MKIEFPKVLRTLVSQPAVADGAAIATQRNDRVRLVLTGIAAAGAWYVKCGGTPASSTNFDYKLTTDGAPLFLEDFVGGDITISPAVVAGDVNVSDQLSSLPPQNQ